MEISGEKSQIHWFLFTFWKSALPWSEDLDNSVATLFPIPCISLFLYIHIVIRFYNHWISWNFKLGEIAVGGDSIIKSSLNAGHNCPKPSVLPVTTFWRLGNFLFFREVLKSLWPPLELGLHSLIAFQDEAPAQLPQVINLLPFLCSTLSPSL